MLVVPLTRLKPEQKTCIYNALKNDSLHRPQDASGSGERSQNGAIVSDRHQGGLVIFLSSINFTHHQDAFRLAF